jgi:hypothetical protein
MSDPSNGEESPGTFVFPVSPDDGLLSRLSFKARAAITTGEFAGALTCAGVAWSVGGDMTLTVIALVTGWILGSIGIATVPGKNARWRISGIIGLLLFLSAEGGFLYWHFQPKTEEKTKDSKPQNAALLFEWKWSKLPTSIPASGIVWTMSIISQLEFGGQPLLLSPRPGSAGDKLTWGEDNRQYGGVYRCDITNYADYPIFNLAMSFKTEFFKPEKDGSHHPGPAAESYDRPLLISKLDPKETFSFYAYSDSRLYVSVWLPKEVTYLRDDKSQREVARLLPQGEQVITLFPMTLIDQTKSPPALLPQAPTQPDRPRKK